ncbi:MAG: hypothetical protein R3350_02060, partial [Saprospiraceae bacterium]|nr:hypothetical protein [Saprospiraceae bacterium]
LTLIPLQSVQEKNIGIDSAWFEAPVQMVNQTNSLIVRVRNFSDQAAENIRLSITYEGQTKPVGTLSVPPRSSVVDTANITILRTGWHEAQLTLTDYPVQFDDKYYFAFNVASEINVLAINSSRPNRFLDAAVRGLPFFTLNNQLVGNLDYSQFRNYQLIVLNELPLISSGLAFELLQYVESGGNLLVFPPREAERETYNAFLRQFPANELVLFEEKQRLVGDINTQEFVFQNVFENQGANLKLPSSQGNFTFTEYSDRREEPLLVYRDGSSYLSKYATGDGHLYLCAAPLSRDLNDLTANGEIFVPMIYKMAISSSRREKIAYTIGQADVLEANHLATGDEIIYKLRGAGIEFIPEQRIVGSRVFLGVGNQIRRAGFYDLFLQPEELLAKYAFNYDRQESDLDYYKPEDLREVFGEQVSILEVSDEAVLTASIEQRSQGVVLWRWCLILALLFLAIEVMLLRFWKV